MNLIKTDHFILPSFVEDQISLRQHIGEGVFLLDNGDLGLLIKRDGIYDEPLDEADLAVKLKGYSTFLSRLLAGHHSSLSSSAFIVQVGCSQRALPEQSRTVNHSIIKEEVFYLHQAGLVERQFFMAIRWIRPKPSLLSVLTKPFKPALLKEEIKAEAQALRRVIKSLLAQSSFKASIMAADQALNLINRLLGNKSLLPVSPECLDHINEQLCSKIEGFDAEEAPQIYSLNYLPSSFPLGAMKNFLNAIPATEFDLIWTASHAFYEPDTAYQGKKLFFSRGPSYQERYQALVDFENSLSMQNPGVKISAQLIVHNSPSNDEDQLFDLTQTYFDRPWIPETNLKGALFSLSLPLGRSQDLCQIPGRTKTVAMDVFVQLCPLYTSANYTPDSYRLWMTPNGEATNFDLFKGSGNRMMTIIGNSESGKSCLNGQFILEFLERFPDGIVRIVDRRSSYGKICDLYEGQLVQFSPESLAEAPYSPFACQNWTEDEVESTVVFIASSLAQANPSAKIEALHLEILSEALKLALNEHQVCGASSSHIIWTDILAKLSPAAESKGLSSDAVELSELIKWSSPFLPTGQFGKLFCGQQIQEGRENAHRLLIYDLEGITDKRLQVMTSQLAFLRIARDLAKLPRSTPKLIIFEELGVLLQGDSPETAEMANRFVKNIIKTARKLEAMAIGITNELTDFTESPGGRSFWQIATQKLFLPLSRAQNQQLKENFGKELNTADLQSIEDLHIKKGHYSQAYLISNVCDFKGTFLIPLSPFMDALLSTSGKQVDLYQQLRANGEKPRNGIALIAHEHPYGIGI